MNCRAWKRHCLDLLGQCHFAWRMCISCNQIGWCCTFFASWTGAGRPFFTLRQRVLFTWSIRRICVASCAVVAILLEVRMKCGVEWCHKVGKSPNRSIAFLRYISRSQTSFGICSAFFLASFFKIVFRLANYLRWCTSFNWERARGKSSLNYEGTWSKFVWLISVFASGALNAHGAGVSDFTCCNRAPFNFFKSHQTWKVWWDQLAPDGI